MQTVLSADVETFDFPRECACTEDHKPPIGRLMNTVLKYEEECIVVHTNVQQCR